MIYYMHKSFQQSVESLFFFWADVALDCNLQFGLPHPMYSVSEGNISFSRSKKTFPFVHSWAAGWRWCSLSLSTPLAHSRSCQQRWNHLTWFLGQSPTIPRGIRRVAAPYLGTAPPPTPQAGFQRCVIYSANSQKLLRKTASALRVKKCGELGSESRQCACFHVSELTGTDYKICASF